MKLLVVTPYFHPKVGGLENYALAFCRGLRKLYKWNIVVVTSNHQAKKDTVEIIRGIKVYRLAPLFKISNTPIHPLWYFKIKKIINIEKPNIINAHTPVPFISDMTGLAAGNIPFFVTYHAYTLLKYKSVFLNQIIRIYKITETLLFTKATKIILVSKAITASIPKKYQHKVVIVNNSLSKNDIPVFGYKNNQKIKRIVFIGNLDVTHEWKGLNEIIHAVKVIKRKTNTSVILSVIGEGNNMQQYKQLTKVLGIENSIEFLGNKTGKAKEEVLRKSSVGVIYPKSSNDAFPTVLLEYWAYKLPVIAANIVPLNNVLLHKQNAYLVPAQSPTRLADGITYLLKNKSLGEKIGKYGKKELVTSYLLENELKKFKQLIQETII